MDIFEYAMQMELDGKEFYLEIASQTTNKGLKSIVEMLANDEQKHYDVLKRLKDENPDMPETKVIESAKNIFSEMREKMDEFVKPKSQIDFFKKAQELEEKSKNYYLEKAGEVEAEYQKKILEKLAEEEKRHYFLLENIIDFVSRPQTWLESAEFNHLDEY